MTGNGSLVNDDSTVESIGGFAYLTLQFEPMATVFTDPAAPSPYASLRTHCQLWLAASLLYRLWFANN
jgi:hypothetical protein